MGTKDEHSVKIISELVSTTEEQDGLVRGPRELLQRAGNGGIFAAYEKTKSKLAKDARGPLSLFLRDLFFFVPQSSSAVKKIFAIRSVKCNFKKNKADQILKKNNNKKQHATEPSE